MLIRNLEYSNKSKARPAKDYAKVHPAGAEDSTWDCRFPEYVFNEKSLRISNRFMGESFGHGVILHGVERQYFSKDLVVLDASSIERERIHRWMKGGHRKS